MRERERGRFCLRESEFEERDCLRERDERYVFNFCFNCLRYAGEICFF